MGAMAGAIVAAKITGIRNWHTAQMRAHANNHEPFGLEHTLLQEVQANVG